jgi:hypothetical protein
MFSNVKLISHPIQKPPTSYLPGTNTALYLYFPYKFQYNCIQIFSHFPFSLSLLILPTFLIEREKRKSHSSQPDPNFILILIYTKSLCFSICTLKALVERERVTNIWFGLSLFLCPKAISQL